MGQLYKSVCYADLYVARAAQCSDQAVSAIRTDDGTLFSARCEGGDSSNGYMYIRLFKNDIESSSMNLEYPTYAWCDFAGTPDMALEYFGVTVGALIVIAMVARIKQIFWKNHEGI